MGVWLVNEGNVPEVFEVIVELPEGWSVRSSLSTIRGPWFQLMPAEHGMIELLVSVPEEAEIGSWDIPVIINTSMAEPLILPCRVEVYTEDEPFDIEVLSVVPAVPRVEAGGPAVHAEITFLNALVLGGEFGSSYRSFLLRADGGDSGCMMLFNNTWIVPSESENASIDVRIMANASAALGLQTIDLSAFLHGGGERWNISSVALEVIGPDLEILDATWVGKPTAREELALHVKVRNSGNGSSKPTVLLLCYPSKDMPNASVVVKGLKPGETVTAELSMIPLAGNNTYHLVVNPGQWLREEGDGPNRLDFSMQAVERDEGTPLPGYVPFIVLLSFLLLVVLVLGRERVRRRGGRGAAPGRPNGRL
jgi:hypothetical protein